MYSLQAYKYILGLGKNEGSLNIYLIYLIPLGNVLLVNQYHGAEYCREANSSSASHKIFNLLCSPIFHYRVHKKPAWTSLF